MRAILEFNFPEDEGSFEAATNGYKYKDVLWKLDQDILRPCVKYANSILNPNGKATNEEIKVAEKLRESLYDLLANEGLNILD